MNTLTQTGTRWVLAWVGAFLAYPIGGLITSLVFGRLDNAAEGILGGVVVGLVVGAAQYFALRGRLAVDWRWIAATTVGIVVGIGASIALFGTENTMDAILRRALLTGLVLGIAQWGLLRQYARRAWLWVPVVTVMYGIAWAVTAQVIATNVDQGFVVFGSSGALVFQLVTGLVLWRMLAGEQR